MSWGLDFIQALAQQNRAPKWRVHGRGKSLSTGWNAGESWHASSHMGMGAPSAVIDPRSVRVEGQRVQPRTWNNTVGGFSFDITAHQSFVKSRMRRGNWMELWLSFGEGYGELEERVAIGVLHDLVWRGGSKWSVRCLGPLAGLVSRMDTDQSCQLWWDRPSTTLASSYTAGAGSMVVADASIFIDPSGAPHDMGVWFGGGEWFRYSAIGGNTLTIAEEGFLHSTAASGTYNAGTKVYALPLYDGHPIDVMLRTLVSTGDGSNGAYDQYYAWQGFGIPQNLIWAEDAALWKGYRVPSGTTWRMQYASDDTNNNTSGLAFLHSTVGKLGFWYAVRQGKFTARAALRPGIGFSSAAAFRVHIKDDDIARVESVNWWSPDAPKEWTTTRIVGNNGSTTSSADTVKTRPGGARFDIDISDVQHLSGTESVHRDEMNDKPGAWYRTVHRDATLRLRGWHWAALCPGDWVLLSTKRFGPQYGTRNEYSGERAMVTAVDPFQGPYTVVTLALNSNESNA